jgi:phage terminase small subunit
MENEGVKSRVAGLLAERAARCQVKQDDVIAELKRLGFSDMRNLAEWNSVQVKLKESSEISDADAACVESVSQTISKDGGSLSIKLHSKTKSLELLARHLGILHDKVDHTTGGKELQTMSKDELVESIVSGLEVSQRADSNA